jgi:hypothetical protein
MRTISWPARTTKVSYGTWWSPCTTIIMKLVVFDCCSPYSISFPHVPEKQMRHWHRQLDWPRGEIGWSGCHENETVYKEDSSESSEAYCFYRSRYERNPGAIKAEARMVQTPKPNSWAVETGSVCQTCFFFAVNRKLSSSQQDEKDALGMTPSSVSDEPNGLLPPHTHNEE